MLELRIAGRDFGQPVLGEVFATIARGDRICLLGPSGVGKTTLLNAIAGLDKSVPEEAVMGRGKLRVGYLFQEHRLLPWRSLNANLKLVGASDPEAETLLEQVGRKGDNKEGRVEGRRKGRRKEGSCLFARTFEVVQRRVTARKSHRFEGR